jgi:DNA-binding NtrC family response regulator
MPLEMQAKILRVIQDKVITPGRRPILLPGHLWRNS